MSTDKESKSRKAAGLTAWIPAAGVVAIGVVAMVAYGTTDDRQAAAGAPLYGFAVEEALHGLREVGTGKKAARPQLPAGVSPNDVYWCEKCQAWHLRDAAGAPQALRAAPSTPVAGSLGARPAGAIPPLPKGFSPKDYYWCEKCGAYHKRQPAADPHGSNGAAAPAGTKPAAGIPPLPAQFNPDDYYWCEKCRAYHKRESRRDPHAKEDKPAPPSPGNLSPNTDGEASPDKAGEAAPEAKPES